LNVVDDLPPGQGDMIHFGAVIGRFGAIFSGRLRRFRPVGIAAVFRDASWPSGAVWRCRPGLSG